MRFGLQSGLVRSTPRQRHLRIEGGRTLGRIVCRGFWEPLLLGSLAAAYLSRPKSAPGPSDTLLVREERTRREVSNARKALLDASAEERPGAQKRLDRALVQLEKIEEELKAAQLDMESYPLPQYLKEAYSAGKVMIAVTGSSGVGKSSFINVLRRLRPRDQGAARTGITETTMEPEMFSFPQRVGLFRRTFGNFFSGMGKKLLSRGEPEEERFKVGDQVLIRPGGDEGQTNQVAEILAQHGSGSWDAQLDDGRTITVAEDQISGVLAECVIWDLPGVGTPNYPQATYLREMGIRYFDVVVLITATRFTEAELMVVQELNRWGVPFFLVRNKADSDVQAEIETEVEMHDGELGSDREAEVEAETIKTIKDYFRAEFGLKDVYCISSKSRLINQYDFQRLEKDLAEAVKRQRTLESERSGRDAE